MTGNPFADGPRPSRARNAASFLLRLAARTLSITIASLAVAWVAFPQTRGPIGGMAGEFADRGANLTHETYVAVHHRFWPEECADDRDCAEYGEVCADSGSCVCPLGFPCDEQRGQAGDRTNEWTQWQMARPLSLAPFCHDPHLISVRWIRAGIGPEDKCVLFVPQMEYRALPAHMISIDLFQD